MNKRFVPVLLAGVVFLAGLVLADEPAGPDEPPVRLKKKKPRGDDKPMTEPGKPDDKKKDDKKKDQPKAGERREAEPVTPQEEEREVYQRVIKNVHTVEEKLAKSDLGEGTQQSLRDILKDIESLIKRNESPPPPAGGGGENDPNSLDNKNQQNQKGKTGSKQPSSQRAGGQNQREQQSGGQGKNGEKFGAQGKESSKKPGGRNGVGDVGGAGGDKNNPAMNRNADLYKAEWGHLPASLRAQMDAYSNPQPFLPKYDELIKRYYQTIAEQGRRK
jgi:hypothetical protein